MLYVARYQGNFSSRREELLRQRSLAEELLGWSLQDAYGLQLSSLSRGRTSSGKCSRGFWRKRISIFGANNILYGTNDNRWRIKIGARCGKHFLGKSEGFISKTKSYNGDSRNCICKTRRSYIRYSSNQRRKSIYVACSF